MVSFRVAARRCPMEQINNHSGHRSGVGCCIASRATIQYIGTSAADEGVVPVTSIQCITEPVTYQSVRAAPTSNILDS